MTNCITYALKTWQRTEAAIMQSEQTDRQRERERVEKWVLNQKTTTYVEEWL